MAAELLVSVQLGFRKDKVDFDLGWSGVRLDVAGSKVFRNIQTITTTQAALNLGGITTPGYAVFRNIGPTYTIHIKRATGEGNMVELRPGGIALLELSSTAPYAIAITGSSDLEYAIVEN